jgi:RND family efflux transporter MFP subunit
MPELSGSYQLQRQFVGRVNAAQRVDVGFEQGGKIDQMLANEGDAIIAGQPLARLDDRFLQVERKELEARQAELQARLQLVRSSLKRQQSLQKQGFSAEQQLDELQAEQDVLLASAQRLQAGLGSNQLQLEKSTLVAPYDGVVSHRYLDQGAVAAAGMPVFQLLESGHLEVVVGVPVTMTAGLVIGDDYAISIGPDTFAAKLLAVGSDLDAITRTVKLRLALPAQAPRDGELALLKLSESRHEAGFWLPVSALTDGMRGLWNCYVLEDVGDGRYRIAAVNAQVLHVDQERVYVAADLEGKRVVSRGLHRVAPGQIVSAGNDELAAR